MSGQNFCMKLSHGLFHGGYGRVRSEHELANKLSIPAGP